MNDLERELAAALKARSASVMPDPEAWEKHRVAALTQPLASSRNWFSRGRVLPLAVAAAVVLVAAIGTGIVVTNNGSAPASAPTPATSATASTARAATTTNPVTSHAATPAPAVATVTVAVPAHTCTGDLLGSAHLTPVGVIGFAARLQLRRTTGGDLLCGGITGTAGGTVQTSTGGTVNGSGPLDLAASSTWDQGSPVFVWGSVDARVSGVHVTGAGGKAVQVQFAALASGRRAFIAVLPANTKTATLAAIAADGRTTTTRQLITTFGEPDALPTSAPVTPSTSSPATPKPPTTTAQPTVITSSSAIPTSPGASTTSPPSGPAAGCDGPGTGIGIADLGVGSAVVSLNFLSSSKTLCFSNGGPLTEAHRVPGVMPYAARTTLVSGPGVWGAVTAKVAKVVVADDKSPNGRTAQLLTFGSDLRVFIEDTAGPVRLEALSSTGSLLYTLTLD